MLLILSHTHFYKLRQSQSWSQSDQCNKGYIEYGKSRYKGLNSGFMLQFHMTNM